MASFWPWEWPGEMAKYTTDAVIAAALGLLVGVFIAIIGLLFISRKLPTPLGPVGDWLIGVIVVAVGILVALGVIL